MAFATKIKIQFFFFLGNICLSSRLGQDKGLGRKTWKWRYWGKRWGVKQKRYKIIQKRRDQQRRRDIQKKGGKEKKSVIHKRCNYEKRGATQWKYTGKSNVFFSCYLTVKTVPLSKGVYIVKSRTFKFLFFFPKKVLNRNVILIACLQRHCLKTPTLLFYFKSIIYN